ncbi:MAG: AraC family transcriptional regulator [Spirochaetes bacterium]|nr:AraC family transcriptional regulator [Spirochaetota bacterium]
MVPLRRARGNRIVSLFLPTAAIAAFSIILSALILSMLYIQQFGNILQVQEEERIRGAIQLFSQIHFGSVPAFLSIMEEEPVQDFLFGRKSLRERALQALKVLDRSLMNNELIDSIYLYSTVSGVLSTRAGLEREEPSDPTLQSFLERVGNVGFPLYRLRKVMVRGELAPRNYFTITFGSVSQLPHRIGYALVVNLSERKIRKALWGQTVSSLMYILDGEGRFLSHPEPSFFGGLAQEDSRFASLIKDPNVKGVRTVQDEKGKRWIAIWIDHPEIHWRFVTLASEESLFGPILRVRNWAILSSFGLLVFAIFGSYLISLQVNRKLQQKQMILNFLREEIHQEGNEVQGEMFHRAFLSRWRKPLAMAIGIWDGETRKGKNQEIFSFVELVEEKLVKEGTKAVEVIELGERAVLIYGGGIDDPEESFRKLKVDLETTYRIEFGGYYIERTLGAKELPHGYACLQKSFRIDYLRKRGELIPVLLEENTTPEEKASPVSPLDLKDLEQAFRTGSSIDAKKVVSGIEECLRNARDPDLFRYIRAAIGYRLPEILHEDAELLLPGGVRGFRTSLSECDRLDELCMVLRSVADRLQERSSIHQGRKKVELVRRVKTLIDQHLSDRSLGTEKIASEVGLSSGYLRELFRNMEGISLMEYMGRKRLEVAKNLLQTSDLSVREVCDRAGFLNYSYFITYFKKNTGYTPKEYRDRYRREKA